MKNNSPHQSAAAHFMHLALRLARHGYGATSPNPMIGVVLVKDGRLAALRRETTRAGVA